MNAVTQWPADNVERRPISTLIPYARNARTHTEAQISQIAASIREWGWTMPILVNEEGSIIAGHARVLAARQLGISECPVMVARGWSESQTRAYVIADNKLALNAGWDLPTLSTEMQALNSSEFDLGLLGFEPSELEALMTWRPDGTGGLTDPEDVPEIGESPVSTRGDLWTMGKHRLICADATDGNAVTTLLGDVKPQLMVTDPPYGVEYDASWRPHAARGDLGQRLSTGKHAIGKVHNDDRADWRDVWAQFPGDVAYVWHAGLQAAVVAQSLEACDFQLRAQIIWTKPVIIIGRGHYHWQHEPCWYAVRGTGHWVGDRKQSTLWKIEGFHSSQRNLRDAGDVRTSHSTQKPVECMRRPMENNSNPGQAVYDPFVGAGTTIIAAEQIGRVCLAVELNPLYVDMAIKRWQAFTGKAAILSGTGHTFDEIAAERGVDLISPEQEANDGADGPHGRSTPAST